MGRNNSPGIDVLELEDHIFSGRAYWDKSKEITFEYNSDISVSERVINKIISQRKARIDLAEDLINISDRLLKMN